MNPIIKIIILTMCINMVAFIAMQDTVWEETFVGDSSTSLFDMSKVDLDEAQSIKTSANVASITGMELTSDTTTLGTGNELVYTNPLSIVWGTIKLLFTFFFALPVLLIQMGLPTYVVVMFGVPLSFIYLLSIFFFVRGVNQ